MSLTLCAVAWCLLLLGVLLQRYSPIPYSINLVMIALGVLVGLLASLWSLWALRSGGISQNLVVFLVGASPFLLVMALVGKGLKAPVIHDVSTAPGSVDFIHAQGLRGPGDHELVQPKPSVVEQQQEAYPFLTPTVLTDAQLADVYARAKTVAKELGWEIVYEAEPDHFEATHTSKMLGFVDDIAVTLAENEGGVVVNLRSVSRVGKSDLGANAARISAFKAALNGQSQAD